MIKYTRKRVMSSFDIYIFDRNLIQVINKKKRSQLTYICTILNLNLK